MSSRNKEGEGGSEGPDVMDPQILPAEIKSIMPQLAVLHCAQKL